MNEIRRSNTCAKEEAIKKENKLLKNQVKELNAQVCMLQEELRRYDDGVQCLPLMCFIKYAEKYPPEQNEYARVVKEMLRDVYTSFSDEERMRLRALGHKPHPMTALCVNGRISDIRYVTDDSLANPRTPVPAEAPQIPACLNTPEAHELLQRLVQAGYVDEHWQPRGLSLVERGELAATVAERLGLKAHWKCFGQIWNISPNTLRTGCSKAQDQPKIYSFKVALKEALGRKRSTCA